MWRFVHVYAWMFLFLPMMIFFSGKFILEILPLHRAQALMTLAMHIPAKNIMFIWGHAEKMVASSKGGSGSRSEAKLFQAMSKL